MSSSRREVQWRMQRRISGLIFYQTYLMGNALKKHSQFCIGHNFPPQ